MNNHFKYFEIATKAVIKAGETLKKHYGKLTQIYTKSGISDLLTIADKESEASIIETLLHHFPDHSIFAEESGLRGNNPDYQWIIDPLDGTTNFVYNLPFFSISVAMLIKDSVELGIVFNPILNEFYHSIRGSGSFLNNHPIKVSEDKILEESLLATGFPYSKNNNPFGCIDLFGKLIYTVRDIRRYGSAALDLAGVASGRFTGFWEVMLNPWDIAAGILLVQEAGGKVTDFWGEDFILKEKTIVASNGRIHNEIIEITSKTKK